MKAARVVIVGAGIGGLMAGVTLASAGCDAMICERAATVGGKVRALSAGAPAGLPGIDAGPTVFTMRWVFDDALAAAGASLDDVVTLKPAHTLARHAWNATEQLDLYADLARTEDAIASFSGGRDALGFRKFCNAARQTYHALQHTFLSAPKPSMPGLVARLGLSGLAKFSQTSPFSTLAAELSRHFEDPRLRQLFGRYATYVGSSPYACPATLMLIAHVEQDGVWLVDGGMHALATGLGRLATQKGVSIRLNAHVEHICVDGNRTTGVRLASGEMIEADAVIFNGDSAALGAGLAGADVRNALPTAASGERSLSAVTWAMRAQTSGFDLMRHNVFFAPDYKREFDDLFARGRMPETPTVYVCAQDRQSQDTAAIPEAMGRQSADESERLLCLINAPALTDARTPSGSPDWTNPEEIEACRARMIERLGACGLTLTPIAETATTPLDFNTLFPGSRGALYGQTSHGWAATFKRPGSKTRIEGLYLAGGTVHPGAGVPMAALSGRLAAQRLLQDLASTRRSHPVGMRGGMSTG